MLISRSLNSEGPRILFNMKLKTKISMFMSGISPILNSYILYRLFLHRNLHLKNPKRFSEKLMYLKLYEYDNNELVSKCCDKYRVREYIKEKGYEDILNRLYAVYDGVDEIDFNSLPESFVLKCNHGCSYNILCPDKKAIDVKEIKTQLNEWMQEDYWKVFAELNYRPIEKKIICEGFLKDENSDELVDYKFYCFNGKALYVMLCEVDDEGVRRFYFFDRNWQMQELTNDGIYHRDIKVNKPEHIEEMFEIAEKLSQPFKFVRVDLYYVNKTIYFGELTFTPSACLDRNRLEKTDVFFGELLRL